MNMKTDNALICKKNQLFPYIESDTNYDNSASNENLKWLPNLLPTTPINLG